METWLAPENRAEVFGWLAAIGELKRADPGLVVVPGHDFEWLRDTANAAGIENGFTGR